MKKNVLIEKKTIPYKLLFIVLGMIGAAAVFLFIFSTSSKAEKEEVVVEQTVEEKVEEKKSKKVEKDEAEDTDEYGGKAYYYSQLESLITELSRLTE